MGRDVGVLGRFKTWSPPLTYLDLGAVSFKFTDVSRREGDYVQQPVVIVTYYRTEEKEI